MWSKKEILLPMLKRQATTNPDDVFGKCPTSVDLAAVFHKEKPRKRRYSQVGAPPLPRAGCCWCRWGTCQAGFRWATPVDRMSVRFGPCRWRRNRWPPSAHTSGRRHPERPLSCHGHYLFITAAL